MFRYARKDWAVTSGTIGMDELATTTVRSGCCYLVAHIAASSNYHNSSSALWRTHANDAVFLREAVSRMANMLVACSSIDLLTSVSINGNGSNATAYVRQFLSFSSECNIGSAEYHAQPLWHTVSLWSLVSVEVDLVWHTLLVSCQINQPF